MDKLVVLMHLTLDGVMQAPGRPDEDLRDGSRTTARRHPAARRLLWRAPVRLVVVLLPLVRSCRRPAAPRRRCPAVISSALR
jgi:hypothetical protein